jgi:hypothetical protein
MDETTNGQKCACPHHKMIPLLITLIGLSFLLSSMGVISESTNAAVWPVFLTLIGLQKLFAGCCKCCSGKCCA